eukprot:765698-Hanusia_phi.AAC.8
MSVESPLRKPFLAPAAGPPPLTRSRRPARAPAGTEAKEARLRPEARVRASAAWDRPRRATARGPEAGLGR